MNTFKIALMGALFAIPALSGCETETATYEDGDTITTPGIDDGVEADAAQAADQADEALNETGEAMREGMVDGVNAVQDGAQNVEDAVDSNIDLGDNAENQ